ncbi:MAG: hypothetical protein L0H63_08205 [Nitrococcus sp.]|nr:hypothetical protein [Nitrococcus sp.]
MTLKVRDWREYNALVHGPAWTRRKAGELLAAMEKAKGALKRGDTLPQSHDVTTGTLSALGITKSQSSR